MGRSGTLRTYLFDSEALKIDGSSNFANIRVLESSFLGTVNAVLKSSLLYRIGFSGNHFHSTFSYSFLLHFNFLLHSKDFYRTFQIKIQSRDSLVVSVSD